MTEPPPDLPGTEPALEPDTLPNHPLRAQDVTCFLRKHVA